jgi:hypothetical protein
MVASGFMAIALPNENSRCPVGTVAYLANAILQRGYSGSVTTAAGTYPVIEGLGAKICGTSGGLVTLTMYGTGGPFTLTRTLP